MKMKQFIAAVFASMCFVQFNAIFVAEELGGRQETNGTLKAERER